MSIISISLVEIKSLIKNTYKGVNSPLKEMEKMKRKSM